MVVLGGLPDLCVREVFGGSIAVVRRGRSGDIVSMALAGNRLRWHVRGYDLERKRFDDLARTQIAEA